MYRKLEQTLEALKIRVYKLKILIKKWKGEERMKKILVLTALTMILGSAMAKENCGAITDVNRASSANGSADSGQPTAPASGATGESGPAQTPPSE